MLTLDATLAAGDKDRLVFHVCGDPFTLSAATENATTHAYTWSNSGQDWWSARTYPLDTSSHPLHLTVPRPPWPRRIDAPGAGAERLQ